MSYWIAKIAYNITWIPWYVVFRFFLNYKVIYQDKRAKKLKGPLILAANHSSWLDPFLLSGAFPMFSSVFPIRFATYHVFFLYFHTALFVRLYGCFQARRGVGLAKVLAPAVKFLEKGQVIGIFPEARRRNLGRPRKGRRGAAYLALKTGSPILPCRVEGVRGLTARDFFLRRRNVKVYVGKTFSFPQDSDKVESITHLNETTNIIMQKINELA